MRLSEGGFSDYPNDYFVQISAMMDNAITYCDNECVFMFSLRFELRPKKKNNQNTILFLVSSCSTVFMQKLN